MSKDMKLIVENWRRQVLVESPTPAEEKNASMQNISVGEFMKLYSDIEPKVEFYDKMDDEIEDLVESYFPKLGDETRDKLVVLIGKTIRAYVGQLAGEAVDVVVNNIIKIILEGAMTIFDVGSAKMYLVQKAYDVLGQNIVKPVVGQYLAEFIEEKIKNFMGKFDPDELGNVKNDAGQVFSVSPAVKNLITNLSDEFEEKLSSEHLKTLSRQLKRISKIINKNSPSLDFDKCAKFPDECFQGTTEFLAMRIVDLKGFEEDMELTGDDLALKIVAKSIGAKKVAIVSESARRRIIYRGKSK